MFDNSVNNRSFIHSTSSKICGYIPVVGVYIGITRIANAVFSKTDMNVVNRVFKVIRGLIEIAGIGITLVPIDLFLWALKASSSKPAYLAHEQPLNDAATPPLSQPLNDAAIIENLLQQGFSKPIQTVPDGRCLFRSIAPQILESDFSDVIPMGFDEWSILSITEQADALRKWAMACERTFISLLPDRVELLKEPDLLWIRELYKDIVQELESPDYAILRENIATTNDTAAFTYVLKNFNAYFIRTSRKTNYAGSSEAIALARLFKREIQFYGQDHASSIGVPIDDQGDVLPYLIIREENPPIYIFQTNGGGHYKILKRLGDPL